jgi:ribosomal protein S18 acetylase RimI-like enzyme
MSDVEVRLANGDDWELWREIRLRALEDAPTAFGSTYERELGFERADWQDRLRGEDGPAVLALTHGRPVGMAGGYQDIEGWLHVVAMWVDPACRRQRVGLRVLDTVVAWARERGLRSHLDVAVGNDAARRLYEGYGFVGTGKTAPLRPGSPLRLERLALPS